MLCTIIVSLLIVVIAHIGYKYIRDYLVPLRTNDAYAFNNDKVSELIRMLENEKGKEAVVDFAAMEGELADLIDNETDIKTPAYDVYTHDITAL